MKLQLPAVVRPDGKVLGFPWDASFSMFTLMLTCLCRFASKYSETVNNRTEGLITSPGMVLVVLVLVFEVPGAVF